MQTLETNFLLLQLKELQAEYQALYDQSPTEVLSAMLSSFETLIALENFRKEDESR